jgi:N-acetylglucosaminyldiphosphoundecaprenol N-acetyl-beta-D-mannosaminyltransferase
MVVGLTRRGSGTAVHLCNAYTLSLAARDHRYRDALNHRAENLADGVPVTWFARVQSRRPQRGPVRGPALMRALLAEPGMRHFFLGGSPEVLEDLRLGAKRTLADVAIVGELAPDFRPVDDGDLDRWACAIRESGADVVWVGLGTPKQDYVLAALADRVDAVVVGVGAAFDFLSGHKKEAPSYLHGSGLEWVHRLLTEPGRLWRRYLLGNSVFVWHGLRQLLRSRSAA